MGKLTGTNWNNGTPPIDTELDEVWRCYNLDCLTFNSVLKDPACWNCGNQRGYIDPEIQALVQRETARELENIKSKAITHKDTGVQWTVPVWAINDRIEALTKPDERKT